MLTNLAVNARDGIGSFGTLAVGKGEMDFKAQRLGSREEAAPGRYVEIAVSDYGC